MNAMQYTHDDPPWIDQKLDAGFWDDRDLRIWYMTELGKRRGFKSPEDWYKLRHKDFEIGGKNLINRYYRTILCAVQDLYPDYDWKMWLFAGGVPDGFWGNPKNRRECMEWLGAKLGFKSFEDWYQVTQGAFKKNRCSGLLVRIYDHSYSKALADVYPEYEWLPWKFNRCPQGLWLDDDNIRAYLEWLGKELGWSSPEDWYQVTSEILKANYGASLQGNIWGGKPSQAAYFLFPDYDWKPQLFKQRRPKRFYPVPAKWWKVAENRIEYMDRLGKELGYSKPENWYGIRKKDFAEHGGTGLLRFCNGYQNAIIQSFPDFNWKPWLFNQAPANWWKKAENRKEYLQWLGEKLGYLRPEDWYEVRKSTFGRHKGACFLQEFGHSPTEAIMQSFPEYDWKPWLFYQVRKGYWHEWKNRRACVDWLGERLNFKSREDWYQTKESDFQKYDCRAIFSYFGESVLKMAEDAYPEYDWLPWKFRQTTGKYWEDQRNRIRYLKWLGQKLGLNDPEDWYKVTVKQFLDNDGITLFDSRYGSIPFNAASELFPSYDWKPWLFRKVSKGFWLSDKNCRDYMVWLEKRLAYTKPEHWYRVKRSDFLRHRGSGFMTGKGSPLEAVLYLYPDFPWEPHKFRAALRSQNMLLATVKDLYPENVVKYNYRHPDIRFSGSNMKMEIDVFLPDLKLGFEYQGEQHYMTLAMYGGEEGLKKLQDRDAEKRDACSAVDIKLIEVPYWWDHSEAALKQMIEAGPGPASLPDQEAE